MPVKPKRLPLPRHFSAALTDKAYERLRTLSADWQFGNNYLLTILLENFDEIVDQERFDAVMRDFIATYGQPKGSCMPKR